MLLQKFFHPIVCSAREGRGFRAAKNDYETTAAHNNTNK